MSKKIFIEQIDQMFNKISKATRYWTDSYNNITITCSYYLTIQLILRVNFIDVKQNDIQLPHVNDHLPLDCCVLVLYPLALLPLRFSTLCKKLVLSVKVLMSLI